MLFFTILFLAYSVTVLIRGRSFHQLQVELGEEEIKKQRLGTERYVENTEILAKALLTSFLFLLPLLIIESIYLTKAVKVDPYLYPSLVALVLFIGQFIFGVLKVKKKVDLSTEQKVDKYRKQLSRTRTFGGFINALLWTSYFGYMTYVLLFLV